MSATHLASEARIIRFLKQGGCEVQDSVRDTHVLLVGEQGTIAVTRVELDAMQTRGILICDGERIAISGYARKTTVKNIILIPTILDRAAT